MSAGKDEKDDAIARQAWGLLMGLVYPPRFIDIARGFGISPQILGALRFLDQPLTMGEMAAHLHCDPSNVTGIVDTLEAKGFAGRRPSAADRRVKVIELTAAGRRARTRFLREVRKPPEWIEALPAADQAALRDLLQRATDAGL